MIDWDMAAGIAFIALFILLLNSLPEEDLSKLTPEEKEEREYDDWVDRNSW